MKKVFLLFVLSLSLILLSETTFAQKGAEKRPYLIEFVSATDTSIITELGGVVKEEYKHLSIIAADLTATSAKSLEKHDDILYVEEDSKIKATGQVVPWGISKVFQRHDNPEPMVHTGAGVKVAILDTGIDYFHEDLNVVNGVSFVGSSPDYMDVNGHGTHVAGTVAALDNDVGVIGIAPEVELYAVKVLDDNGDGNYSNAIAGIEWALENHMDIVNMSFGSSIESKALKKALKNAYNEGILFVSSAGNSGMDKKGTITYPAAYKYVIAVGAVDEDLTRTNSSSVGKELELMAPGYNVYSTLPNGMYGSNTGTSMASPHVTGIAALLIGSNQDLNNESIRDILEKSAISLGDTHHYGFGLVQFVNE